VKGTVVHFNFEKYYGFIQPESAQLSKESNLFFHASFVLGQDAALIKEGVEVEFTSDHDRTGRPRAVDVRVIDRGQIAPADLPLPPREDSRRRERRREAEKLWNHPGKDY
jgi:cold shock CspA family protein